MFKVSASLANVGSLAVGVFDVVKCSFLSLGLTLSLTLVSKCSNVVIGLWAMRMLLQSVESF